MHLDGQLRHATLSQPREQMTLLRVLILCNTLSSPLPQFHSAAQSLEMNHGVVQKWLRQVVGPYDDQNRVYTDVDQTLIAVSSLSPKTEVYTYDDGRSQLLLVLNGTIPITYRSSTYNIPMAFWIPRSYPKEAPMAYVTPTNDMLVRKGKNVDLSGRVGGDYLERWRRKWEGCSLLEFMRDCQMMFGQEPPVYAKPKNQQVPASNGSLTAATSSSSALMSPNPASPLRTTQSPLQVAVNHRERGPPPKPGQEPTSGNSSTEPPRRPPKMSQGSGSFDEQRRMSNGPTGYSTNAQSPRQSIGTFANPDYVGQRYTTEPIPLHPPGRQPYPEQNSRHASWNVPQGPSSGLHYMHTHNRAASYSSDHRPESSTGPPTIPPLPPSIHGQTSRQFGQQGLAQPDAYPSQMQEPVSNLQSPAPAPPRPPNPELLQMHNLLYNKIQTRIQFIKSTSEQSQDQFRLLCEDLDRGELAIKDEMARLEAVRDICRSTGDQFEQSVNLAKSRIAELTAREEPDVDGLLSATSLVGNQLIELVAEDNAIEDTLYHLGRALNSEVLDLDRFLKQTRFLAREQFMRRALAQKICQGMGWEMN